MYLQDLATQNLLLDQLHTRMPALFCPGPVPFLDSPFSMEEKPSCISWKLWHTPGRPLILTGKGLGPPGKASALQCSIAGVSTGCTHCWLRPPTPLSHGLGRQQQRYSGNPCCWDSSRETQQHRGCSTSFVTSVHGKYGEKIPKSLMMPGICHC